MTGACWLHLEYQHYQDGVPPIAVTPIPGWT